MTLFQAIVYSAVSGFAEFLPISASAHRSLIAYILGWPEPGSALLGGMALGTLLAVVIYFIHDWASMVSCFIQVIVYRKKPMTLDERLPLFLFLATLPAALIWYYFRQQLADFEWTPLWTAGALAAFSIPLWVCDSIGRKNKGMFDWNWLDSLVIGIFQAGALIQGCGWATGSLSGSLLRNYNRESATKFAFFASTPILLGTALFHLYGQNLHSPETLQGMGLLSWIVTVIVSFFTGLLAIGGFMRHMQKNGLGHYVIYRCTLAGALVVAFWLNTRR